MDDEARPLNSRSSGALPPCCCPLMFCATAGSSPWIDRLSHRFFEVSFEDAFRQLVEAYLECTRMSPRAFGLDTVGDGDFVRVRLGEGASVRLGTADRALEYMGQPPFGPLFLAEVEAYLAITGTKAYLLGELAVEDASFVTRLRQGLSPTLGTVDRVRGWMGEHSTAPQRRAIAAATLHTRWWRLGAPGVEAGAVGERDAPLRRGRYLTAVEVAEEWGLSTRTLARLRADGEGPAHFRFGNQIRYARSDLEAWEAACRRQPSNGTAG